CGAEWPRALIIMLVAVVDEVDAVILEHLRDLTHLIVTQRRITRGVGRLVIDYDLPGLVRSVEIRDEPVAKDLRIGRKRAWGFGIDRCEVDDGIVEMRIGIEENEMRIAVVEGVVAHVVDLAFCAQPSIDKG